MLHKSEEKWGVRTAQVRKVKLYFSEFRQTEWKQDSAKVSSSRKIAEVVAPVGLETYPAIKLIVSLKVKLTEGGQKDKCQESIVLS